MAKPATTKRKMLRFGGDGLPDGRHTWYMRKRPGDDVGKLGVVQVMVFPGDIVPADVVVRETGLTDENGEMLLEPNAEYFIQKGMASYVDEADVEEAPRAEDTK